MFRRLQQLRKLWLLSNRNPLFLERIDRMQPEEIRKIPEAGDGRAVFIAEPTAAEYERWEDEQSGWAKFFDRANGALGNNNANSRKDN